MLKKSGHFASFPKLFSQFNTIFQCSVPLQALEMKSSMLVGRYGSDFYEGFRLFYIMCAEAFAANSGNEYMCGYYVFEKQ